MQIPFSYTIIKGIGDSLAGVPSSSKPSTSFIEEFFILHLVLTWFEQKCKKTVPHQDTFAHESQVCALFIYFLFI